ncbi:hypothetical protein [Streptomyces sp. NBC_01465]|uniref:hypothetical protein n=1 Tax=Streptomyces sp. NBC_01465 TaxID=2903878 RepID=UPI002E31C7D1|nr:hypothetical protein [Streptomyces sp. NBC_01465]
MYALVALVPFVLLGTVMGLSWWEDRILPRPDPAEALTEAPFAPADPAPPPELPSNTTLLTDQTVGR